MNISARMLMILSTCACSVAVLTAPVTPADTLTSVGFSHSPTLQRALDTTVTEVIAKFANAGLRQDQLAITLIDLTHTNDRTTASHRGYELIYPASVVKLFYLFAVHHWLHEGRLQDTAELRRALSDMIVLSYNEPTHYLIDLLTETTSGPELSHTDLERWHHRRDAVNRYFTSLGYQGINVNKKPWCEGPYGREIQAIEKYTPSRNWLSTDATARLITDIFLDRSLPPEHCADMRRLMRRELPGPSTPTHDQSQFIGSALPPGALLWSKAGWTSRTRHDAACVQLPNGQKLVLVIFTTDHAEEPGIMTSIVRGLLEKLVQ